MSQSYDFAPLRLRHLRFDHADRQAEGLVNRLHPLGVAAGEVVVDRRQMAALAGQRVQIQRQRGGERFAFAGLHLDDRAVEHGDAAQELHVEMPHVQRPPAGLADQGEALDEQSAQRLAAFRAITQRKAFLAELLVAELLQFGLESGDFRDQPRPTGQPKSIRPAQ